MSGNIADKKYAFKILDEILADISTVVERPSGIIEITEILFLLHFYKSELADEYDCSLLILQLEAVLEKAYCAFISREDIDGYAGAGYAGHYFLSVGNKQMANSLVNYIVKNQNVNRLIPILADDEECVTQTGITHGVAFYIYFLSTYYHCDNKKVIYKFVENLMNTRLDHHIHNCHFSDKLGSTKASPLNLAYGDLGILYAQILYAKKFNNKKLYKECINMYSDTIERSCHIDRKRGILYGCFGLLLYFKSLHLLTDELIFDEATNYWKTVCQEELEKTVFKDDNLCFAEGILGEVSVLMSLETGDFRYKSLFFL